MDVKIPFLGDGINTVTVLSLAVAVGDTVKKDQTVLELETDKAVAPVPSPADGKVEKILVSAGAKVGPGTLVLVLSNGTAAASAAPASVNVAAPQLAPAPAGSVSSTSTSTITTTLGAIGSYSYESKSGAAAPAAPSIRQMAMQMGLDLNRVKGSGNGGRITLEDVRAHLSQLQYLAFQAPSAPASLSVATASAPVAVAIDYAKVGAISRKPLSSLRQKIGQRMVENWTTIPHVTQNDEADITALMELRKKYKAKFEKKGASLTLTTLLIKPVIAALKKLPHFNASLDMAAAELVLKQYFNIGVAVDSESGLMVPVLKNADQKSVFELSLELGKLAEKTRSRKIGVEEMQGGGFTISNLGGFGVGHFTPIINSPEVAILGVGGGVLKPVVKGKKIAQALMLPLSLSYDHRIIDGADGARFIREIISAIENFKEAELKG